MPTLVSKLSVFGAKVETTPGTKVALTATEAAYNVYDLMIEPDLTFEKRQSQGSFGSRKSTPSGSKAKATFKMDFEFDGLAVPAWADVLLPACGLVKTGNIFKPVSRTPDTSGSGVKTLSLGKWWGPGKFIGVYGAMGTFKLNMPTGKPAFFEFEFQGVLDPEADVAMVSPTYPTPNQLTCKGGPVTYDSVNLCIDNMVFDIGNDLYVKECPNKTQGYEFTIVTNREPKFTSPPESLLVASQNRMSQLLNGTEAALRYVLPATGYVPNTGAKSVEILAPQAQFQANKQGDRNGVSVDECEWIANNAAGTADSDFTITFNI